MTSAEGAAAPGAAVRARVRMVARPASVPAVRRFVDQALCDGGWAALVPDVQLAATELATNAMLHSGTDYFEVELRSDAAGVRLEVLDRGATRAGAIAARGRAAAASGDVHQAAMGGRGLFIVSALATSWGLDDLPAGTRIWAYFLVGGNGEEPSDPQLGEARLPVETKDVCIIELRGCPPQLLLDHDTNLADIASELRLYGFSHRDTASVAAAERVGQVVRTSALSWDAARLVAQQAVLDGVSAVDVAIAPDAVADVPRKLQILRDAVGAAEEMMAQGLLMTLPARPEVQQWRDWVEDQMLGQATGERDPVTFPDWIAGRR